MTESHLPEDSRLWPNDPFELLGVSHEATERDAKRAYARLIRKFNPEHAPDEFRLIRDAYENARHQIQWGTRSDDYETEPVSEENEFSTSDSKNLLKPRGANLDAQLHELWQTTKPGQYEQSYQQLKQHLLIHPFDEEIAVRLYWLQVLNPDLDASKSAVDWLRPCLNRQGGIGRIGELFVRALNTSKSSDESELVDTLLTDSRSRSQIFELLQYRWRNFVQSNDWQGMVQDLNQLEPVFLDDISQWLHLHLLALELTKFSRNLNASGIVKRCQNLFENESELGLQYSHYFDRAEHAVEVHQEMNHLHFHLDDWVAPEIRQMLLKLGANPQWDSCQKRESLMPLFAEWVRSPEEWIEKLGRLSSNFRTLRTVVFEIVSEVYFDYYPETIPSTEELRESLSFEMTQGNRITDLSDTCNFLRLRREILEFCVVEHADLDTVIQLLEEMCPFVSYEEGSWLWRLREDFPLKTLIRGHLLFWSTPGRS